MPLNVLGTGKSPMVLLHGWGTHARVWSAIAERLAPRYRLYLVDLPGHGARLWSATSDFIHVTRLVADALPGPAHWVGWSLGGILALEAAAALPGAVSALTAVCASPRFVQTPDWPGALSSAVLQSFARDLEQDLPRTLSRFLLLQTLGTQRGTDAARTLRRHLREGPLPDRRALAAGLAYLQQVDLRPCLAAIRCPVAFILGGRDTLVPAAVAPDIQALRPDWPVHIIAGAGHAPFLSHPDAFINLLIETANHAA